MSMVKDCQRFSGETMAKEEGGIMKNEMASLLLDDKFCFMLQIHCQISCRSLL